MWRPFVDFFRRTGLGTGIVVLLFVVLYKLPDNLAIGMSTPFLLQIGFSETEIGTVVGAVGLGATIVGSLFGGGVVERLKATGWPGFFPIALLAGIPALLMLPWLAPWHGESPTGAAEHTGAQA